MAWRSPPVRFHSIQQSIVPRARSPSAGDAALGQQPLELGAAEVGIEHETGASRTRSSVPASASASQRAAVRRSCHTIARQSAHRWRGPTPPPSPAGW